MKARVGMRQDVDSKPRPRLSGNSAVHPILTLLKWKLLVMMIGVTMKLLFLLLSCLSQSGLLGGDVTPLLDDGLLDLPGVGTGPGADLLGDVNALLLGLEERNQLGDVLARSLGLQVAVFLRHLGKKFKPGL